MEKTPKEYFVKVGVNEELPTSEERYHVIKKIGDEGFTLLDSSKFYKGDNKFSSSHVTHWLKPIPSMPEQPAETVYTKEKIVKMLDRLLAERWQRGDENNVWETDEGDITSEKLFDDYLSK